MDLQGLSKVNTTKINDSKKEEVQRLKRIADARKRLAKRRVLKAKALKDSKTRITKAKALKDSKTRITKVKYNLLKKRIKDELEDTDSTDSAVEAVLPFIEESPAEDVLQATVEILGEVIDRLDEETSEDEDVELEEEEPEEEEEITDSNKFKKRR